jgi:hypothetical protein
MKFPSVFVGEHFELLVEVVSGQVHLAVADHWKGGKRLVSIPFETFAEAEALQDRLTRAMSVVRASAPNAED